jgi:hypothetical protein
MVLNKQLNTSKVWDVNYLCMWKWNQFRCVHFCMRKWTKCYILQGFDLGSSLGNYEPFKWFSYTFVLNCFSVSCNTPSVPQRVQFWDLKKIPQKNAILVPEPDQTWDPPTLFSRPSWPPLPQPQVSPAAPLFFPQQLIPFSPHRRGPRRLASAVSPLLRPSPHF